MFDHLFMYYNVVCKNKWIGIGLNLFLFNLILITFTVKKNIYIYIYNKVINKKKINKK